MPARFLSYVFNLSSAFKNLYKIFIPFSRSLQLIYIAIPNFARYKIKP